jgi:xanthine dehydrogenase accessory factor
LNLREAMSLEVFLAANPACVLVTVGATKGSTPREQGAFMLVCTSATFGTIGGGQLEYSAIDKARQMLTSTEASSAFVVKLGPEIGQCCGGEVLLTLELLTNQRRNELLAQERSEFEKRPHVYIFGAGHVGNALANAFALLPVVTTIVDQREKELALVPLALERLCVAMPETVVKCAPPGSVFLVLTHDHALDFLIVREALERQDAAYIGMIGSKSKRGTFNNWYLREGGTQTNLSRLVSPIGGNGEGDKRPAIIAALAAAEVVLALSRTSAACRRLETTHV